VKAPDKSPPVIRRCFVIWIQFQELLNQSMSLLFQFLSRPVVPGVQPLAISSIDRFRGRGPLREQTQNQTWRLSTYISKFLNSISLLAREGKKLAVKLVQPIG